MLKDITQQLIQYKREVQANIKSLESEVRSIESALGSLTSIRGDGELPIPSVPAPTGKKRTMSAAARAKIAAAQRARWARVNAGKPASEKKPAKKKIKFSAAGLAKIRAAQKRRWAKYKAQNG